MTTLILETGSGLANSNSYADVAYANDYFSGHPYYADSWDALDPVRKTNLLIAASRSLDLGFEWDGRRLYAFQAMAWPRVGVVDSDGYVLPTATLPRAVRDAACEQARYMSVGDPTTPPAGEGLTDLKIDVIELSFDKGQRPTPYPSPVLSLLRGYGRWSGGVRVAKVLVG